MMHRPRHGVSLIYCTVSMIAMIAITSLAVDLGRVQLVKTELMRAADAACRAAVYEMQSGNSISAARTQAVALAAMNTADGTPVAIDSTNDVLFGTWDETTQTFTQEP